MTPEPTRASVFADMVSASYRAPIAVLLVGEACARRVPEQAARGLAPTTSPHANDAVARLRMSSFPLVAVAAALPDMAGAAFVDGLLRHFETTAVLLIGDVDPASAQNLQRTGRVAVVAGTTPASTVAEHLALRAAALQNPSTTPASSNSMGGAGAFPSPQTPLASSSGGGSGFPSLPPFPTGALGYPGTTLPAFPAAILPTAPSSQPPFPAGFPSGGFAMPAGTGFSSNHASSFPPGFPASPDSSAELDGLRGQIAHLEAEAAALRTDAAQAQHPAGEAESLRFAAATAEAERDTLRAELDRLRRAGYEVQTERDAARAELEPLRRALSDAQMQRDAARASVDAADARGREQSDTARLAMLHAQAERDRALQNLQSVVDQQRAALEAERAAARAEGFADGHAEGTATGLAHGQAQGTAEAEAFAEAARGSAVREVNELKARLQSADVTCGKLNVELEHLRADRNGLQAALQRSAAVEVEARTQADLLHAEMERLRVTVSRLTQEHALAIGELERHRSNVELLQNQLEEARKRPQNAVVLGDEASRARLREFMDLVRALEPFAWGLSRASAFFSERATDGANEHLRALQLLGKTLERLKSEIDRLGAA